MKMSSALASRGCEVLLVARERPDEIVAVGTDWFSYYGVLPDFKVKRLEWASSSFWYSFLYVMRGAICSIRWRPELVVSRNLAGSWILARLGFSVAHESHAPWESKGKLGEVLFRLLSRSSNFVGLIVISTPLLENFVSSGWISQDRVLICPDGADHESSRLASKALDVDSRPKVGYFGSLHEGRGIELICEVAQLSPWADFTVTGGPESRVDYWRTRTEGIDNLQFTGRIAPGQVKSALRTCDYLLAPYQPNTTDIQGNITVDWMSPLKVFEYMASGVPMIASELPVLKEVLVDEENCLLANPLVAKDWAACLIRLRDNPSLADALAHRGLVDLENNYSWGRRADTILQFFQRWAQKS